MAGVAAALISGLLFGLGLAVSQMVNPAKVLGFLDIAGGWDPSLALVLVAAAGIAMIGDYPLGAGGDAFKRGHGPKYIAVIDAGNLEARSLHNGYLNETCEGCRQGLLLRVCLLVGGVVLLVHASRRDLGKSSSPAST